MMGLTGCFQKRWFPAFLLAFSLVTGHGSPVTASEAKVEQINGLRVVHLSGTPYEIGFQHGSVLHDEVRASVNQIVGYFRKYLKVPILKTMAANWWLDRSWNQSKPFIPKAYLQEMRGLADGSGVDIKEIYRLHAVPDRTYSCASLAAWGDATANQQLIHTRNLDWNIDVGIQEHATVFVVRPEGKQAYVNIGWAGFIGVLTGISEEGISVGQIGAETTDISFKGLPMIFLLRSVLESATDLEQAQQIVSVAPRTVGINYVFADAKANKAIAIETTHSYVRVFKANDSSEQLVTYARPIKDAVFRADTAFDPVIRNLQIASGGKPNKSGLEPPTGSAYEVRYLGQADGIEESYGRLDVEKAKEIAKSVAPSSNVQSVIFAWPEVWIANAIGTKRAAHTKYHLLNVETLFTED